MAQSLAQKRIEEELRATPELNSAVNLDGKKYTAEQVSQNPDLSSRYRYLAADPKNVTLNALKKQLSSAASPKDRNELSATITAMEGRNTILGQNQNNYITSLNDPKSANYRDPNKITSRNGLSPEQLTRTIDQQLNPQQSTQSTFTLTGGNLKVGARGDNVKQLQQLLGITADGIFGPQTQAAVRAFQQKNGLAADGIVGPLTTAALNKTSTGASGSGTTTPTGGQNSATGTTAPQGGNTGYSPVVGTSDQARAKTLKQQLEEQQKALGIGNAPKPPETPEELTTAKNDVANLKDEIATIQDQKMALQDEMKQYRSQFGKEITAGGLAGALDEKGRELQFRMDSLNRQEILATTKLSNRQAVVSDIMQTTRQNYQDAVTAYNTQFSQKMQLYSVLDEEQDELKTNAKANIDTIIDTLKDYPEAYANPNALTLAQWSELETQAGYPKGYLQTIAQLAGSNKMGGFEYKGTIGGAESGYSALWVNPKTGETKVTKLMAGTNPSGPTGNIPAGITPEQASDPFIQSLLATAGGKKLTDTSIQKLDKALTVLGQLGVLQANIEDTATGPVTGAFRGKNPWDTNAQTIKASLNAIVPNLARGVFGEVGVLTDNDIKVYSKTLPNLTSTESVRNGILYITLDMIGKSIKNTLSVNAAAKRDVSGFVEIYTEMENAKDSVLSTIPGAQVPKAFQGNGGSNVSADETLFNSVVEEKPESSSWIVNLWNKIF